MFKFIKLLVSQYGFDYSFRDFFIPSPLDVIKSKNISPKYSKELVLFVIFTPAK